MKKKYEHKEHAYLQIAHNLEKLIGKEVYKAGEKLPSIRKIKEERRVSMSTVLQAYSYLEAKGIITAREKSGYFVNRIPVRVPIPVNQNFNLGESEVRINAFLEKLMPVKRNKGFISFSRALPDSRLLPVDLIKKTFREILRTDKNDFLQYEDAKGNEQLRSLLAKQAYRWQGIINAEDIVITNGALEAIHLCLKAVTKPGDVVVVETPCYYGILQTLENLSLRALEIPGSTDNSIDVGQLRRVVNDFDVRACIFVSNFNNPTGSLMEDHKKEQIACMAKEMKIPVIEDDIYGDLHFFSERPKTIKTYDKDGWVMLCSSFSKTLAPGMRIGWAMPGRLIRKVQEIKFMTNIASSSIGQQVIGRLLELGSYERFLKSFRIQIQQNISLAQQLVQETFPKGTKISNPGGGLVLWIELPEDKDSILIQQVAMENNIGIAPGPIFSNRGLYKNYIRLNCGNYWDIQTQNALKRLGKIIHNM